MLCAAPAYLGEHRALGTPRELTEHLCLCFMSGGASMINVASRSSEPQTSQFEPEAPMSPTTVTRCDVAGNGNYLLGGL